MGLDGLTLVTVIVRLLVLDGRLVDDDRAGGHAVGDRGRGGQLAGAGERDGPRAGVAEPIVPVRVVGQVSKMIAALTSG